MLRALVLIAALLSALSASADQFDYLCLFSNAAAAQADPGVGAYWNGASWNTSLVFPAVKVITPASLLNGISTGTGFWIVISSAGARQALINEVVATGPCYLGLDRDVAVRAGSFVVNAL